MDTVLMILARILVAFTIIDPTTKYIMLFTLAWPLVLIVLAIVKPGKKIFYQAAGLIPVIHFLIFYLCNYTKGKVMLGVLRYGPLIYLLIALWLYKRKDKKKKLPVILGCIAGLAVFGWCIFWGPGYTEIVHLANFSRMGYADSVAALIDELEENYLLRDHKQIDFDSLRAEYIPMAQEAEDQGSEALYTITVERLCNEFHDGHVGVLFNSNETFGEIAELTFGNDYGFSMVRLDDGSVIAVNCARSCDAYRLGIHDGTVITAWNGTDINEAIDRTEVFRPTSDFTTYSVIENEDIVRPMFLAGTGGETVDVSFLDEDGNEQEVTLTRLSITLERVRWTASAYTARQPLDFAYTQMLDDHIGYMCIPYERYDKVKDIFASLTDDYPEVTDLVAGKLDELRSQGMDCLILDLRGNGGGLFNIAAAMLSVFSDHDITYYSGYYDGEAYQRQPYGEISVHADGRYSDIPVVVLVNAGTASCGDIMTYTLSSLPNVTVMGLTTTWGSAQGVGGRCLMSDSCIEVRFTTAATMDENGNPVVDAGPDRRSAIPLDVTVPLTRENALRLYPYYEDSDDEEIYLGIEVDYAVEYLNGQ